MLVRFVFATGFMAIFYPIVVALGPLGTELLG